MNVDRTVYYLGNATCAPRPIASAHPVFHSTSIFACNATYDDATKAYASDMSRLCKRASTGRAYRVWFGDLPSSHPLDSFTFTKVRWVDDQCGVLLPLNFARHWSFPSAATLRRVVWEKKRDGVVWRGTTTGEGVRRDFVHALAGAHDVCFSSVVQKRQQWVRAPRHLCSPISIQEQLLYKYLLVLPGNDVATGLKWALTSSSLVLMPTPKKETWLMEGSLTPWVHFVPVDDPSHLTDRLLWLRRNADEAKRIVARANQWMDVLLRDLLVVVPRVFRGVESRMQQHALALS